MLYRVYTKSDPLQTALVFLNRDIQSFSVIKQEGFWKGTCEKSITIEVFDEHGELEHKVYAAAEEIRALSNQEVVYIVPMVSRPIRSITG